MPFQQPLWAALAFCFLPTLFSNTDQPYHIDDDTTPRQKAKHQLCLSVYSDIVHAVRDYRQPPTFHFIYQEPDADLYYNAYYNPKNNGIYMSEPLYDLATEFGADSLNVLAMILGHELAHFYKGHGWGMSFGMANEDIKIAQQIYQQHYNSQRRQEMEAEADYFGGLFGYLAGYNTLKIGGKFFKRLYQAVQLPDTVQGYPTLNERVKICENSQQKVAEQLPVFRAATWMTLLGDYRTATACYEHLLQVLPSRELYNNEGVLLALEALHYYSAEELRYAYPFALDMNTYFDTTYIKNKGNSNDTQALRRGLLERAAERFQLALKGQSDYTAAQVNLALTQTLLGKYDDAAYHANAALQTAEATKEAYLLANARIARGIIHALKEEKKEAKAQWESALSANAPFAEANLEVLKDRAFARVVQANQAGNSKAVSYTLDYETIGEESLQTLQALYDMRLEMPFIEVKSTQPEIPSAIVYSMQEVGFQALLVQSEMDYPIRKLQTHSFLLTLPGYAGKTAKGIRIGSSLADLEQQYGKARQRVSSAGGLLLVYPAPGTADSGLVFELDAHQTVMGWGLYAKW